MIAIIDYGVGNLFSLCQSLKFIGCDAEITASKEKIRKADKIILPGVGAFGDAIRKLNETGLVGVIRNEVAEGKDILGICLGMQLLFDKSYEYGEWDGLGLLSGSVVTMSGKLPSSLHIPHMGWNPLIIKKESRIMKNTNAGDAVYFVHSFYADNCADSLVATVEYGIELTATVEKGNIMGCQFHPEKSGQVGMDILRAFAFGGKEL